MVLEKTPAAIVLNKPPGLATQGGTKTHSHVDGLLDAFVTGDGPRPRLVHRLDKDTSGVLLIARTPGSAAFFSKRFSGRSAKKVYWALVVGVPDIAEGLIDAAIAKQPGTGGEKMHVDEENGQPAKTKYRVLDRAGNRAAWLELEPLTGRTHQLRVHCAAIGHPIVGDGKYGGQEAFLTGSISRKMHLHARRLIIDAPGGGKLDVTAELPEHFAASMEQLGFDPAQSDAAPEKGPPPPTRAAKKQAAKAHAKEYRKGRRGERRTRGAKPAKGGKR
jgi:23S rRNA pseudouridine955/2504/2580 synthase